MTILQNREHCTPLGAGSTAHCLDTILGQVPRWYLVFYLKSLDSSSSLMEELSGLCK